MKPGSLFAERLTEIREALVPHQAMLAMSALMRPPACRRRVFLCSIRDRSHFAVRLFVYHQSTRKCRRRTRRRTVTLLGAVVKNPNTTEVKLRQPYQPLDAALVC